MDKTEIINTWILAALFPPLKMSELSLDKEMKHMMNA